MWVSAVKLIIAAGEVGRPVTQQAYNHLDPLREHVHPFLKRGKGMPKARCSCSFQPAPRPNTSRPLRVSTAAPCTPVRMDAEKSSGTPAIRTAAASFPRR